ncbi:N-acetyltransferase [Sphingomonas parva]|uniref:N-acetyltransferase n=1 Tax=Sphingomonas parva TaxID=2555898 RepID=A0A4Y8ZRG0_9SPHN|nr:GNAT family N-acetyltransferase [Sphingomonas parva]TFI57715.1 N-acetyltransferase [Sphingomonas parva]
MNEVQDNPAAHRFELVANGEIAIAEYRLEEDRIVFTHTMVPPALEGQGIGSRLVRGALDQVRARGLKVVPRCPFVRAYIERHEEMQDLLA